MNQPATDHLKLKVSQTERLDAFLVQQLPDYSRSSLQKLCREAKVTVNGQPQTKAGYMVRGGDQVELTLQAANITPVDVPVLYEDADVVVLNKPAGMLTHAKGPAVHEFTIGDFMRSRTTDGADGNRPGIVHRLDRGTSGIIIAAKTTSAKRWLQKQFASRKVKKTYIALVEGVPAKPEAIIRLPIERNPKKSYTFRVGPGGKPAETIYKVLHQYGNCSLVQLMPTTGRTHQLRVHLTHLNHPIVGDELYGHANPSAPRMFLHAAQLELTLPRRERRVFTAPLPDDLQNYLKTLD